MRNPFKRTDPDPFAASRFDGMLKGGTIRERRRPWLFRHTWAWVTTLVLFLIGAISGYVAYRYYHLQGQVQERVPGVVEAAEDEPFNVILVGSDSRAGLTEEEQQSFGAGDASGERADTIIVAHVDPATDHITMVQIPRDLYVPIAGTGTTNKINSALLGGKGQLVATIKELTGIDINRYAQVNIAGFRDIVDAIGGVDLCITEPVPFDPQTGIEVTQEEIDESPLVHFDGERALRFVRSRNFPTGDFERIRNQQRFLAAAIDKVLSVGTLLDVGKVHRLIDAMGRNVRIDEGTDIREMVEIARRFRSFDPANYEAYTAPNLGTTTTEAGISIVVPDMPAIEVMFDAIRNNESPADSVDVPDIEVATIDVGVYNGTLEEGVAAAAAEELETATTIVGQTINVVEVANAERLDVEETFIRFDPVNDGAGLKAELIAAAIPGVEVKRGDTPSGVDVEVVVGNERFRTQKIVQITPIELPKPGEVPEGCR
ncbi:MAG: LCP family protein [Actinomycetota bacterium]